MKKVITSILVIIVIIGLSFGIKVIFDKVQYNQKVSNLNKKLNANLKIINDKSAEDKEKLTEELANIEKEVEEISNNEDKIKEEVQKIELVGIGDSVFEDALSEIKKLLPNGYYDAKISRPLVTGNEILRNLKNQGKLTNTILLGLANNGFYTNRWCTELMDIVGNRTIYWLNSVGPDDPSYNAKFKEFAKNYSNIHIIDWEETSKGHSEYFYKDGTHLKPAGLKAYAEMIYKYIYDGYKESLTSKVEEKKQELLEHNKQRLAFYGNDLLLSISKKIYDKNENAVLTAKRKYKFTDLVNDIKTKKENNQLEYNLVFVFDEKTNISKEQYDSLIEVCEDRNIYIVNVSNAKLTFENAKVKVIDFYDQINKNKDYLEFDKTHLSEAGIKALTEEIFNNIESN